MDKKQLLFLIGMILLPVFTHAGGGTVEANYTKAVQFLQGDGLLEYWFTEGFLGSIQAFGQKLYGKYIFYGQAIGGLTGLIYLANKGWEFISGDKPWEVMPLLRPLAFALVIANWTSVVAGIQVPFKALSTEAKTKFNTMQNDLLLERIKRFKTQSKLVDAIFEMQGEQAAAETAIARQENGYSIIGDAVDDMSTYVVQMGFKLQFGIQLAISNLFEIIGLLLMRLVAYGILFIQQIFTLFLIIIGPISFGFSILPAFRSAWVGWFSKFIAIQFYSVITYVIMQMGVMLQLSALESENTRYAQMLNSDTGKVLNMDLLIMFGNSGSMTFGMVVLAFLLTALGLLMVPTLSSYILGSASSTSGVTSKAAGIAGVAVGKLI